MTDTIPGEGERMGEENPESIEFCQHSVNRIAQCETRNGVLVHIDCGLPIKCEFYDTPDESDDPYFGPPHPATHIHIDYRVCDEHSEIAADNVWARTL